MRIRNSLVAAAVGAVLVVTASGCGDADGADSVGGGANGATNDELPEVEPDADAVALLPEDIKARGTVTMAADLHYPPTSFLAEDQKTPVGYNVDIATLLGEKLGLDVEVKNVTWDGVVPRDRGQALRLHSHQHDPDDGRTPRGAGHDHLLGGRLVAHRGEGQP